MDKWAATSIKKLTGVETGTVVTLTYQALEPLRIEEIKPGCGCTTVKYDENTMQLTVDYKAETIPKHLKGQGWFYAAKVIVVKYVDGDPDRLTFTLKVIDNGISI
jgi:hypothetical protein